MSITADALIKSMFRIAGITKKSEAPTADEMTDALQSVNFMLDSWSSRKLLALATIQENFPLQATVSAYNIGVGSTWNTTKPFRIPGGFIRDSSNVDSPLGIFQQDLWDNLLDKDISTGRPDYLFYNPGVTQQATQQGTVNLYPIPDSSTSYTIYIDEEKPFTEFANLTTTVTFPPSYYEAIKYNGAIRIFREYFGPKVSVPPDVKSLADEAMRIIENVNSRIPTASCDLPGRKGGYNIYTDQAV